MTAADAPTSPTTVATNRGKTQRIAIDVVRWAVVAVLVLIAAKLGWSARTWTYEHTTTLRHVEDIRNNFYYGSRAIDEGWLNLYANVRAQRPNGNYTLDYVPLRLLVMRQWAASARETYGADVDWRPDLEFTRPLLAFNAIMEALAAIAVFLLVWLWRQRGRLAADGVAPDPWHGVPTALLAGALLWFSPASMLSAMGWPSSDAWIVTFYLYAILLACANRWLCSGLIFGIGIMFKGQMMLVMPLFILWPLFMLNGRAALGWMAGIALSVGTIVSPWLLRDATNYGMMPAAIAWIIGVILACAILATLARLNPSRPFRAIGLIIATALLVWPTCLHPTLIASSIAIVGCTAILVSSQFMSFRQHAYLAAGTVGAAFLTTPLLFNSDLNWLYVSFRYGSEKYPQLAQYCANTFPALLALRFRWEQLSDEVFRIGDHIVTLRIALTAIYGAGLVACAASMAWHSRRRDPHFLIAMAAPWLVAYAFMPQMHERYLLFPASIAAAAGGLGIGMLLLDLLLIVLAWCGIAHLMFDRVTSPMPSLLGEILPSQGFADAVQGFIIRSHPDMAWAIMLLAVIYLYLSLTSSRLRRTGMTLSISKSQVPDLTPRPDLSTLGR